MTAPSACTLLAVDVGLTTGLAMYDASGRLQWYRSQHFANSGALRRAVRCLFNEHDQVTRLCLEGGGDIARIWTAEARRRGITVMPVIAETWRKMLLLDREHRSGSQAKDAAGTLARRVIAWSEAPRPTVLRHDTAEAILVGLWAVHAAGWLPALPAELRP